VNPDNNRQKWDSKHLPHSRFISEENDIVAGWAALTPISSREVYRGVAEVSIYVANGFRVIGTRERIAQLDGKWRDTILLERRSSRFT